MTMVASTVIQAGLSPVIAAGVLCDGLETRGLTTRETLIPTDCGRCRWKTLHGGCAIDVCEVYFCGSVALFESFRCSALDLRLCGFIEQVSNEFNFVVNAGFVVCKMSLLDSSECFNSFQCVFGRA